MNRKSAPRVKLGQVQKKNNWTPTANYYNAELGLPTIDRGRPGKGFRHLLKRRDIEGFIELLPDWPELSVGLNAIVLAPASRNDCMGWHEPGVVHVCAWEEDLWWEAAHPWFAREHRDILDRLGVPVQEGPEHCRVLWTEGQARAFQLLHVLLHELGHHHDRMSTRSRQSGGRGEAFAEDYARRYADQIWDDYLDRYGADLLA
jgi:hypothetical protein